MSESVEASLENGNVSVRRARKNKDSLAISAPAVAAVLALSLSLSLARTADSLCARSSVPPELVLSFVLHEQSRITHKDQARLLRDESVGGSATAGAQDELEGMFSVWDAFLTPSDTCKVGLVSVHSSLCPSIRLLRPSARLFMCAELNKHARSIVTTRLTHSAQVRSILARCVPRFNSHKSTHERHRTAHMRAGMSHASFRLAAVS